jgi:hypothetical protein
MKNDSLKKIGFDLSLLTKVFQLEVVKQSDALDTWLNDTYTLTDIQTQLLSSLYEEVKEDGGYWNEEELKIQFVGLIFRIADVSVRNKIKVFYERSLSSVVNNYELSVVCDCLIATPLPFNTPDSPYFFLQEFKKKRGEKKDPEAQMLTAMLIAQSLNNDNKIIYGGYLISHNWHFSILDGRQYSTSRQYDATEQKDLLQIVFILRKLKELILLTS